MTRRLTVAERLATTKKDLLLEEIADQSSWDRFLVEQAVLHFGEITPTFSCNDLRTLLPEMGHGYLGAAINGLNRGGVIERTGDMVPSTQKRTHAHGIHVWRLTGRGHEIAAQRRAARREQAA
jgi:ribosomal protein L34